MAPSSSFQLRKRAISDVRDRWREESQTSPTSRVRFKWLALALLLALGALGGVSCLPPQASTTAGAESTVPPLTSGPGAATTAPATTRPAAPSTTVLAVPPRQATSSEAAPAQTEPQIPATGSKPPNDSRSGSVPVYLYSVVQEYPHDPSAYTQGLVYEDETLYEGTGLWGASSLRRVDLETGEVLQFHQLPAEYFGEGIAVVGGRIFQLTYQSRLGFVYDRDTFELLDTFNYPTQGWGLAYDGTHLIMSDGSDLLRFLDPATYLEVGSVAVQDKGRPIHRLNELEYIQGEVFANVYVTDLIARIDPLSGDVTGWINLTGLLTKEESALAEVLNGIAYDSQNDRLFVTGKMWPKLFEIDLVPLGQSNYLPHVVRRAGSNFASSK